MKKQHKYLLSALLAASLLLSCDNGFDEINKDPVRLVSIDPTFQLNRAIIGSAPGYNNFTYETTIVKQMITPFVGVGTGGNLNLDNKSATQGNWQDGYSNTVKNLVDGIAALVDKPDKTNLLSMLRIWKAHEFMILTDSYGELPYFQAAKGYTEGIAFPEYDTQEAIYDDILKELEEASNALDPAKDAVPQEVMYAGLGSNILRWKRLGFSLLLRAAMRLTKVNPAKAQQFAAKAIAGGLMESNLDNAVIRHDANFRNDLGTNLNGGQAGFYYIDRDFMTFLKDNNDPRLKSIAIRYVGAKTKGDQIPANGTTDPALQIGMPQGFDNTTIPEQVAADGLESLYDYSEMDRRRLGSPEAPSFMVTYSETLLLKAEAIIRGWAAGDASAAYESGIRAHMEQMASWPGDTSVDEADIVAYIASQPLQVGMEIEQINNQYWVSSFLNGHETWANFRRSGFPIVAPNPLKGDLKTEDFIQRLTYPDSEHSVNAANLDVAIGRQGPDDLDVRVWWDVK
ncbi:MAG: SusD/RagB family nutrient-binding outer membrane lipoprotein [Cyclobacteriaceae bacterium]|nr:SusD/RagB family nutrient-binding outer membrane lipoprotein [Cyclobacteriaceae bacterium]MDH4297464.1 SusD/RagB family nutrient-binding outer membrane lipoprotein [Cyclobacteriaceae bacterium]MDH5250715.1 SusD/RagB family nutrient-binding outer membrane lipoprotein [Cyclobacteriaceae bacterium]